MSPAALAATPPAAGRRKRGDTRERLLNAARTAFCERGYLSVSVEDIAAGADVSRITFYRYFPSKAAQAIELFRSASEAAMPRLLSIGRQDYRDPAVVKGWIAGLFEADRSERRLLRAFIQAAAAEPAFTERAQEMISQMISGLGATVPAFALDPDAPHGRKRWLEAWLLLYELLDQSNHAALDSGVAGDPLVAELLAERFLSFVTAEIL